MKKTILALSTLALLLAGCASDQKAALKPGHARCVVCEANNDLACIDVVISDKTPRVEYHGATYYFCSEECATHFRSSPEKYLAAK